ncbi:succinate dehydrogenase assembly factor 2 [Maricaulis sp.]|uniref:FAD assembly factor SdhE n=1 Tax=Maricaulis sp. TaxID=1486257 RepID=UPI0026195435|nr:succinate dehydrogenase assembly factor 2 [Maricaulis sp.]
MTETIEHKRKKLRIRAWRRGFKEADLILGRFADQNLDSLSDDAVVEFEHLLDQTDADLYAWIIGREPTPAQFDGDVMQALKRFRVDEDAEFGDGPRQ